ERTGPRLARCRAAAGRRSTRRCLAGSSRRTSRRGNWGSRSSRTVPERRAAAVIGVGCYLAADDLLAAPAADRGVVGDDRRRRAGRAVRAVLTVDAGGVVGMLTDHGAIPSSQPGLS